MLILPNLLNLKNCEKAKIPKKSKFTKIKQTVFWKTKILENYLQLEMSEKEVKNMEIDNKK